MRKQVFRRGTAAYRLAKAQGRLPSQKAAKKKAKVDESMPAKVLEGFGKMKAAPKAKAAKKAAVKRTPSGRMAKPEEVKKSGGGRGKGERLINMKPVKKLGGKRTGGQGKKSRDTKLFSGKFTSRGNRR